MLLLPLKQIVALQQGQRKAIMNMNFRLVDALAKIARVVPIFMSCHAVDQLFRIDCDRNVRMYGASII